MSKYVGKACPKCGGLSRYTCDNRCVACRRVSGRKGHAKLRAGQDDNRMGLPNGFVRFGTLAYFILKLAHEEGFVSNRIIRARLLVNPQGFDQSPSAIAANLIRLEENKFLYKVGRDRIPGSRSFALFSIDYRRGKQIPEVENLEHNERSKQYRARKKIKVNSVFNWRGQHESELSERAVPLGHGKGEHPREAQAEEAPALDDRYCFGPISLL